MKTPCVKFVILTAFSFGLLAVLAITFFSSSNAKGQTVPASGTIPPPVIYTWTTWGAEQYAVADAGDDFWIGASGGIVRWHKPSESYQRYSGVDGLPHRHVYAIAVDGAGNRWFGGDGGLSRLDSNEVWTHFTPANSGLPSTLVDGIAVGADNTLWVSHGLPDGRVSRRNPDGSWSWFPSRTVAVGSDYSRTLQTQNQNPLWAVASGEVWVDFLVYDGTQWWDRTLNGATEAPKQVTAAAGSIWALTMDSRDNQYLHQWHNGTWSSPDFPFVPNFGSYATSFAVSGNGDVWVGYNFRGWPYSRFDAGILRSDPSAPFTSLGQPVPVVTMLAKEEGVWAVGPHWLHTPDGTVHELVDTVALSRITDIILHNQREIWFNSYDIQPEPYSRGAQQTLIDQGSVTLSDDRWIPMPYPYSNHDVLYSWERTPQGDILSAWGSKLRFGWYHSDLLRDHQGRVISISLPIYSAINDIFALDDRHFWLVYRQDHYVSPDQRGVLAFDDGGTPSDFTDDSWQDYPITSTGTGGGVAVDAVGRLWYGNSDNLYLLNEGQRQAFFEREQNICDLTVDGEGSLYILTWYTSHCVPTNLLIRLDAGNTAHEELISSLIAERYFALRTVPHRNKLWTVAPDGAIWYLIQRYSDAPSSTRSAFLERYDGNEVTAYPLPFTPETALQLEVDAYNNVWFVHDNQLWRMSQPPGFVLAAQPLNWQVEPGLVYSGEITLRSRDGYSGTVMLSAIATSSEVSVTIAPNRVAIGQIAKFTLTVAADSQQSAFDVKLFASDAVLTQTTILSVTLRGADQNFYLPLLAR